MSAHRTTLSATPLLAVVALAGVGLAAWSLLRPEPALRRAYETALAHPGDQTGDIVTGATSPLDRQHLWLSRAGEDEPFGLGAAVQVGDRIHISGRDGHARVLEVVDIRTIDVGTAAAGRPSPRLLMVSCREMGPAAKGVVRFLMEAEAPEPPTSLQAHRTL